MTRLIILSVLLASGLSPAEEGEKKSRHSSVKGSTIEDYKIVEPEKLGGSDNSDGVSPTVVTPGGARSLAPAAVPDLKKGLTVDGQSDGTGPKAVKDWVSQKGADGNNEYQKGLNINGKDGLFTVSADSNGNVKSIQGNGVSMQNPRNKQGGEATLQDVSKGNLAGASGPKVSVPGSC